MEKTIEDDYIFVFTVDNIKIGLPVNDVERVLRAIASDVLPGAPDIVSGVVNLGGDVVPVVDFRKRINNKSKKINTDDKLVVVRSSSIRFAFFVEDVSGLEEMEENTVVKSKDIIPGQNKYFEGITVIKGGIVLVHDIDKFLSIEEEEQLQKAISKKK